jgi:hypothetical protein
MPPIRKGLPMQRSEIKEIVSRWMFPPEKTSYMGGIEDAPGAGAIARQHRRRH